MLELCALAALVYWGAEVDSSLAVKIILALAAPTAFIAIWGMWIAPRARRRLPDPKRLGTELALFAAALAALAHAGKPALAAVFAAILALNEVLVYAWGQRQTA